MSTAIPAHELLRTCWHAAVAAVRPEIAMRDALTAHQAPLRGAYVIALGKGAAGMAHGLLAVAEERGEPPAGGFVVSADPSEGLPASWTALTGDHPEPADRSRAAADALGAWIDAIPADAEVHVLISGGTSALIAAPRDGVSDAPFRAEWRRLLASGLDIHAMNAERRTFTRWSDGRLAAALAPRRVTGWLLSDVPGDEPAVIGSGPLVGGAVAVAPPMHLIATNRTALDAAARAAAALGVVQRIAERPLTGEASEVGRRLATEAMRAAVEWRRQNEALFEEGFGESVRPLLLLWGGETTVTRPADGEGLGGRAQELALAAAAMLEVSPLPVTMLAAGTDGRDGPTDAAGAMVDRDTWRRAADGGVDPAAALAGHDAYRALDAAGALFRPGRTGTNVMDLVLAVVGP